MAAELQPARLGSRDLFRASAAGLRARPLRALLSALGIAIGIGAMVAVVGISSSSQAGLEAVLSRLGTNMLTVTAGKTLFGQNAVLPQQSVSMVARIPAVTSASAIGDTSALVYRNDRIPADRSGGIAVYAAELNLPGTVGATVVRGAWLNAATARFPVVVIGASAAQILGINRADSRIQLWIGGHWFTVVGILGTALLAPELDNSVLVGWSAAQSWLGFDGAPSTIYERSLDSAVEQVHEVLAQTANPQDPEEVIVSRPSDALAARVAANQAFTGLLLGIGAVALLVGGIGVANTMVISVLERRTEVGLRRSLGATRGQIRVQFLAEALLLSALGGLAGVTIGMGATAGYAIFRCWPVSVPPYVVALAIVATVIIGGLAGLYPAMRAARLAPSEVLAAT